MLIFDDKLLEFLRQQACCLRYVKNDVLLSVNVVKLDAYIDLERTLELHQTTCNVYIRHKS